jgi:peptide/nickel transport system ATP-binding protein
MGSIPTLTADVERLTQIPGSMPRLTAIPQGCAFNPRCSHVFERCRQDRPDLMRADRSLAACWLYGEEANA